MFQHVRCAVILFIAVLALGAGIGLGESTNAAVRAQNAYVTARSRYQAHPAEAESVIKFARACFEHADFASSKPKRVQIAREGISAVRSLLLREPTNAAAHYYLALNLGQVAQVKRMSALSLITEMESELLTARSLDEKFDHAGPDRCLGLIYQDAPGWPISIGSREKTREHFLHAIELFPTYPDNRLCLIEISLRWGDRAVALEQASILKTNWSVARAQLSGAEWNSIWKDWQERWDIIQTNLGISTKRDLLPPQR